MAGAAQAPATAFAALYHRRWRIEEAFKRLKSRLHIEAVSGLNQHAVLVDVAAKVLADDLASLMCAAAHACTQASADKRCARAPAVRILQCAMPPRLLAIGDVLAAVVPVLRLNPSLIPTSRTGDD